MLAAIDILAPGWIAFKECDHSENLSGWVQAHDQILEYDFDYIVCGHVSRYGTRDDVLTSQEYAHDLVRFSREALETVPLGHFLEKVDSGSHKGAFRTAEEQYFTAVTNYATKKMLERVTSNGQTWPQRLNGADVMTKDNCFAMAEKIRLEQHHNGYMGHDGPPEKFFM